MDPAVDRATELLAMKQTALPLGALQGAQALCRRIGVCMGVYITAFAYYAQIVEGLKCEDPAYAFQPGTADGEAVKEAIDRARANLPNRYFLRNPTWDADVWWEVSRVEFDAKRGMPVTPSSEHYWQAKSE